MWSLICSWDTWVEIRIVDRLGWEHRFKRQQSEDETEIVGTDEITYGTYAERESEVKDGLSSLQKKEGPSWL